MRERRPVLVIVAAVLAVVLTAFGLGVGLDRNRSSENDATAGLRGVVLLSGCVTADNDSCSSEPIAATQIVRRWTNSRFVKKFRSNSDGSFRVGLRPGRYFIERAPGQDTGGGLLSPKAVVVPMSGFAYVKIVYQDERR